MTTDNFLQNGSAEQTELGLRIFDLVIGRVLKQAYTSFDEKTKEEMEKVFLFGSNEEKTIFIEKNIPDFQNIFKKEAQKIEEELKLKIEK